MERLDSFEVRQVFSNAIFAAYFSKVQTFYVLVISNTAFGSYNVILMVKIVKFQERLYSSLI